MQSVLSEPARFALRQRLVKLYKYDKCHCIAPEMPTKILARDRRSCASLFNHYEKLYAPLIDHIVKGKRLLITL